MCAHMYICAQEMFDLYKQHFVYAALGGVHITPKHHLGLQLWKRSLQLGNPKEYANWYDEHLNATLASVAKLAYPAVYERRVLAYFKLALESQIKHRR